jgi:hypothetical protein
MQDTFSLALEARTTWANFRIAVVASEGMQTGATKSLADAAGATARLLGFVSFPDATMPNLIADVPELIQQWSDGYAEGSDAQTQYAEFLADWASDRRDAEDDAQQMRAEAGENGEEIHSRNGADVAAALSPIDAATFRAVHTRITKMASEANRRCGQSYEYMVIHARDRVALPRRIKATIVRDAVSHLTARPDTAHRKSSTGIQRLRARILS